MSQVLYFPGKVFVGAKKEIAENRIPILNVYMKVKLIIQVKNALITADT